MRQKVVIGGFGSTEGLMKHVAEGMSMYYDEDVASISFRKAMDNPSLVEHMARRAMLFTHSAGLIAARNTSPSELIALAPPRHTAELRLVDRAIRSGAELIVESILSTEQRTRLGRFGSEVVKEVLYHPISNLGRLSPIASSDAIEAGIAARKAGISASLGLMDKDRLFPLPLTRKQSSAASQVGLRIITLRGGHEELLCEPYNVIDDYESESAALSLVISPRYLEERPFLGDTA